MDNGHEPATKADLTALEQRLGAEMKTMEDRMVETFRDGQTELLKAFYSYTESTDLKLRDGASTDANLRDRLSVVERRLTELERKVNFPNQQ